MLITHERTKLINCIVCFKENTLHCKNTKLFKLLYFLDFKHYQETGRNVTGLIYQNCSNHEFKPVPISLLNELNDVDSDLSIINETGFSSEWLSKRELMLIEDIASQFKDSKPNKIFENDYLSCMPSQKNSALYSTIQYNDVLIEKEKSDMLSMIEDSKLTINCLSNP